MIGMGTSTHAVTDPSLIRFARRLSHDLNNYATVVRTYSELLLADLPPDSPSRADVEEIQRAAEGMVAYIQRVTRFARASMMRRGPVSIDDTIADVIATAESQAGGRRFDVQVNTGAVLQTDPQWLREALLELVMNAHEAAPDGTPVRLDARVTAGALAVRITDAGAGTPPDLGDPYEPYVTSKHGVRGAGQGLALAQAFALACDGSLSLERVAGESVATLRVPLSPTAPSP